MDLLTDWPRELVEFSRELTATEIDKLVADFAGANCTSSNDFHSVATLTISAQFRTYHFAVVPAHPEQGTPWRDYFLAGSLNGAPLETYSRVFVICWQKPSNKPPNIQKLRQLVYWFVGSLPLFAEPQDLLL